MKFIARPHCLLLLLLVAALVLLCPNLAIATSPDRVSLVGRWRFELDKENVGINERWFDRVLPGEVRLPGSLPEPRCSFSLTASHNLIGRHCCSTHFLKVGYTKALSRMLV